MKTSLIRHSFSRAVIGLALSGGVALGLAGTAQAQSPMSGQGGMHGMHERMHGMHEGRHGGDAAGMPMRMTERLLDRVQATPEQRAQIRKIMDAARSDMRTNHEGSRSLRDKAAELLTQPTVDGVAVEAVRQQMLARHDEASKRMTQSLVEASRVLTPEQRQQLAASAKQRREMMQRHHPERRALEAPKS